MNEFDLRPDPSGGFDFLVDGRFLREIVFDGEDMENVRSPCCAGGSPPAGHRIRYVA